jgi:predicted esterase
MKSATVFLCFGFVLLAPACTKLDTTLEQAFAGDRNATAEKPLFTPEPIRTPGRYDLTALKAGKSFLLWVPEDYTPERSWPLIFCYHGAGGSATTWPFQQVTGNRGFIIIGMNYTKSGAVPNSARLIRELLRREKNFFFETLEMVSGRLNVDKESIFMGGYSQGGYHTTFLGENVLDKLAGLVVLGAGRFYMSHTPPLMKSIKDKPIFIGVGEMDTVHNPRSENAAETYKRWEADVIFEEWPGVGHGVNTPQFPSKLLLDWLNKNTCKPANLLGR